MIDMLRRRLMGNMAKAKNIVMGTVTASSSASLTIPAFGFNPDHVAVFTESGSTNSAIVISIFDGHTNYIKTEVRGSLLYYDRYTKTIENAVSENGVTYATPESRSGFSGTYRYVAWQE